MESMNNFAVYKFVILESLAIDKLPRSSHSYCCFDVATFCNSLYDEFTTRAMMTDEFNIIVQVQLSLLMLMCETTSPLRPSTSSLLRQYPANNLWL